MRIPRLKIRYEYQIGNSSAARERDEEEPQIPSALASAFQHFDKRKQPFSYFGSGFAPDLSDNPRPSAVRRSQSRTPTSDNHQHPHEMPTVEHLQYNSPLPLYSSSNVHEAYGHQVPGADQHGAGKKNIAESGAYRLIHEQEEHLPLPPRHSERLESPTPDWHGKYINPQAQSPSFKRLQYAVPGTFHTDEAATVSAPMQAQTYSPGHTPSQPQPPPAPVYMPQAPAPEAQQGPLDPAFAQKVAEAERPKVPPSQSPAWAETAERKVQSWSSGHESAFDPRQERHYPTGSEVEAGWTEAGLKAAGNLEYQPKHYPAGAEVQPSWATTAVGKHQKWMRNVSSDHSPRRYPTGEDVKPDWSGLSHTSQDKWASHYSHYNIDEGQSGQPISDGHSADALRYRAPEPHHPQPLQPSPPVYRPRAKSVEPPGWRGSRQSAPPKPVEHGHREWMKPFIAPNLHAERAVQAGSVVSIHRLAGDQKTAHRLDQMGLAYGPGRGGGHRRTHTTTTSSYSNYGATSPTRGLSQSQVDLVSPSGWVGSGYSTRSGVGGTSYVASGAPSWQRTKDYIQNTQTLTQTNTALQMPAPAPTPAPPPPRQEPQASPKMTASQLKNVWETKSREETVVPPQNRALVAAPANTAPWSYTNKNTSMSSSWSHESDAWKQRQQMEEDLRKRQEQQRISGSSSTSKTVSGGGPVVKTYTTVTTGGEPPKGHWQNAAGASTKAATSGTYIDPEGQKVSYVKEIYTSSDPGREFSMLTQEEKKINEEPVEPGIISRHTTTKYYKKSTYTNATTTSSTQPPPNALAQTPSRQPINWPASRQLPQAVGSGVSDF